MLHPAFYFYFLYDIFEGEGFRTYTPILKLGIMSIELYLGRATVNLLNCFLYGIVEDVEIIIKIKNYFNKIKKMIKNEI